jgi:hypothetical protein
MANAWITFLTKYYQDRKKKQPGYSYSDAMKDAKIEYNKTKGNSSPSKSHKKGKKMRGGGSHLEHASSIAESTGPLVRGEDMTSTQEAATGDMNMSEQSGGKKSRRRKGTKGKKSKKSKKCKSKRKSRSSRK